MTACGSVAEILPHHDAILALLKAIAPGPPPDAYLGVYDGRIPDPLPVDAAGEIYAYCVLYATPGQGENRNLAGHDTTFAYSFDLTVVGADQRNCLWALDRVRGGLIGRHLSVPGRDSGLIQAGPAARALRRATEHSPDRHVAALTFDVATT